jgi:predicted N-acetyltransferase YhbS
METNCHHARLQLVYIAGEAFMALELADGALFGLSGKAVYPPPLAPV